MSNYPEALYANIKQREQDIYGILDNTLIDLQNSTNNTKENVKLSIITGKGKTKENTAGIETYKHNTTGVLALREVERTYRHKFGYSLGYVRTDFEMSDSKNEDESNTIQLGLHNSYKVNGWTLKNNLLGRVSIHNVDRNIEWATGEISNLKSDYNVYGVSSLNELGKDLELGKNVTLTPYAGLELGYMSHDSFREKGSSESLEVERNNGYSIKPSAGVRMNLAKDLGTSWKVKGNVSLSYEYELGEMTKEEKASLNLIEEGSHKLASASKDEGKLKTSANVGIEFEERYGVYLIGEYGIGNSDKEEYRAGVTLKAVF